MRVGLPDLNNTNLETATIITKSMFNWFFYATCRVQTMSGKTTAAKAKAGLLSSG
jgi:hypothetical protein